MVYTAPDTWSIKQRIQAIIQADSNVFTTTGEADKLRKVIVGWADQEKSVKPMAFITNAQSTETVRPVSVISNEWKSLAHDLDFEIHVLVDGKNSAKLEERLDDFKKLLYQTIGRNNQLTNPVGGTDPKVSTCWPRFGRHEGRGTEQQILVITIHCITTSGS